MPFESLKENDKEMLGARFLFEEVEEVVQSFEGNKSPGPDGFNFKFIQNFWSILKDDIWGMVNEFFETMKILLGFKSYFVALIPKINNPQCLSDFCPISLMGCLYKIISKLLACRLKRVLDPLISNTQSAFIANRNILDGVVVINEVVDYVKKKKEKAFILKVDFEKAYDSVNWKFLEYMMGRFGFSEKWRGWIRECIFSRRCSVLVNGSPTEEVDIQKGLKQGDPLSPFLYLMVAEGLSGLMKKVVNMGKFTGCEIGNEGPMVSILQYADDTLLIGEAIWENMWVVKTILRC